MVDDAPSEGALAAALRGGDVASVILAGAAIADDEALLVDLVTLAQGFGAAAILAADAALATRAGADGVHLTHGTGPLRRHGDLALGVGADTRDAAMEAGEAGADYVLLGPLPRDTHCEPHSRFLDLARWWVDVATVPCIVAGGTDHASAVAVAETGAEFVALRSAVFESDRPADTVGRVNAMLDAAVASGRAPRFE